MERGFVLVRFAFLPIQDLYGEERRLFVGAKFPSQAAAAALASS